LKTDVIVFPVADSLDRNIHVGGGGGGGFGGGGGGGGGCACL